jgi:plastocyanin
MPRHRAGIRTIVAVASAVAVLGSLAVLAGTSAAAGNSVTIKGTSYQYNYRFSPKTLTVNKNTTVTWAWNSDVAHNVTFTKLGGKHSKTKKHATGFKVTFTNAGTFKYMCTVHGFTGKIVVVKPKP